MKYIVVNYKGICGEYQFVCVCIVPYNKKTVEDSIHSYFKNFWPGATKTEEKAQLYSGWNDAVAAKITNWKIITKKEKDFLFTFGIV